MNSSDLNSSDFQKTSDFLRNLASQLELKATGHEYLCFLGIPQGEFFDSFSNLEVKKRKLRLLPIFSRFNPNIESTYNLDVSRFDFSKYLVNYVPVQEENKLRAEKNLARNNEYLIANLSRLLWCLFAANEFEKIGD